VHSPSPIQYEYIALTIGIEHLHLFTLHAARCTLAVDLLLWILRKSLRGVAVGRAASSEAYTVLYLVWCAETWRGFLEPEVTLALALALGFPQTTFRPTVRS
jgi:hypothetical protein